MDFIRHIAYASSFGPFPVVVWVGLLTYLLFVSTAGLTSLKRWNKTLRRVPVKVHRRLAVAAVVVATIHLVLGMSIYV